MRICLINPPSLYSIKDYSKKIHTVRDVQHIGLGYIAAVLEKNEFEVDVIECGCQDISLEKLYRIIEDGKYEMIGISTYFYNLLYVVKIAKKIKKISPNSFLFLGGYYPTLNTSEAFKMIPNLSCCVLGEGEYTCLELAQALEQGEDYREIRGIAYKESNEIIINKMRPLIDNLDELPIPKITYLSETKIAPIISTRGCYGSCTYCATLTYTRIFEGKRVRKRSVKNTFEEMKYLVENYKAEFFIFQDDIFFRNCEEDRLRVKEFCKLLKESNLDIKFMISMRANDIKACKDLLIELMDVGLDSVFIGVESFVERQLRSYGKSVTVEDNIIAVKTMNEIGLVYSLGIIIYEPFTDINEILTNIKRLREINYDDSPYSYNTPISMKGNLVAFYGCPFYKLLKEKKLLEHNELGYKFINKKMDELYNTKKLWVKKIEPVYQLCQLIDAARYNNEQEIINELNKEKSKLLKLDLDFMEKLCIDIRDERLGKEDLDKYTGIWDNDLKQIEEKLLYYKSLLSKYF